jgi:hypothetical protein
MNPSITPSKSIIPGTTMFTGFVIRKPLYSNVKITISLHYYIIFKAVTVSYRIIMPYINLSNQTILGRDNLQTLLNRGPLLY